MNTVVLEVRSLKEALADASHAMKTGRGKREARISFATPELLWEVLTAKRWELLKALCGTGPLSIRAAARRVGRDVKAVHGDVKALLEAGILDRTPDGRIQFPFDAVKGVFLLRAAQAGGGWCRSMACRRAVLRPAAALSESALLLTCHALPV